MKEALIQGICGIPGERYTGKVTVLIYILFLLANLVTTSKALVTRSDALVPGSEHCY